MAGDEAVYILASWASGEFFFTADEETDRVTIQKSNTRLLMEAAHQHDEWRVLARKIIDERYNLTDEEFRVEDGLIALGPLPSEDMLSGLIEDLENSGLVYFDDFFELSGNWPDWLSLYARGAKGRGT